MNTNETTMVLKSIERLEVSQQVWLLGRRVRVIRLDQHRWKVIPHDRCGKGDPLRFAVLDTLKEVLERVAWVSEQLAMGSDNGDS